MTYIGALERLGRHRRLGGRGARALLAISLVIAATMAFTAPSSADPYGPRTASNWGEYPNGADHSYCFRNVASAEHRGFIDSAMQILDQQTDITAIYHSTCTASTDVAWVLGSWCTSSDPNQCPVMGLTVCETILKWLTTRVCDRNAVYIDLAVLQSAAARFGSTVGDADYNLNLRSTMCHELGHTVGVEHYGDVGTTWGCMGSSWAESQGNILLDLPWIAYVQHHVDHINAYV
jgi:hypothetical protein